MILSAIDIGSNALRMMTVEVSSRTGETRLIDKLRSPVRIGHDVFSTGTISNQTIEKAVAALKAFIESHNHLLATRSSPSESPVGKIAAVATSALRDARNRERFIEAVRKQVGIDIEIISGAKEAELIQNAIMIRCPFLPSFYHTLDIGGGSIEIGFINKKKIKWSESFPMGTVRCLNELRKLKLPESQCAYWIAETWIAHSNKQFEKNIVKDQTSVLVGTGGNMESILDLGRSLKLTASKNSISRESISEIGERLSQIDLAERVRRYHLRVDRSDVIIPAITVTLFFMRKLGIDTLVVPKVGLRDGIILDSLT